VCLSCRGNLELWIFFFHFSVKASSCSKDECEHMKYSAESHRSGAVRDTCSKAIKVVKATVSLAETCDEVPC